LRKLEKIQKAKRDEVSDAEEAARRRAFLDEVRRTPEGRALALRVAQQLVSDMQARERAQIERMTSPEQLERLRKQWAEEDAESETREEKYLKEAKVTPEGLETFLREITEGP
jgi:acyl-CoA reductase-like NAD-dependent aldehyde dehydrogenase